MSHGELESVIKLLRSESVAPIAADRVLTWMNSRDIETLGAVYELLTEKRFASRIKPSLDLHDYHKFMMEYFGRCLREDPQANWADSRYSAGADFVGWFRSLWRDASVPRSVVVELRRWLGGMYAGNDEAVQVCIVTAILEHLFEDAEIQHFFASWKRDPVLRRGWEEAASYSRNRP